MHNHPWKAIYAATVAVVFSMLIVSPLVAGVVPGNEKKAIFPEDRSNEVMGFSMAADGDTVVACTYLDGAGGQVGMGYVFTRQPDGEWKFAAKLSTGNGTNNLSSGWSVAIDGDVIVMGLHEGLDGLAVKTGVAQVFVKPAGGWASTLFPSGRLVASDRAAGDSFGDSVVVEGDVIVVGATQRLKSPDGKGAVYVFLKPAAGWNTQLNESAKLIASDAVDGDALGYTVDMDGDVVVATARNDSLRVTGQGSGYVFVKPAGGWVGPVKESAQLGVVGAEANDALTGIAIEGDTIVAGAPGVVVNDLSFVGAMYIFERPVAGWTGDIVQSSTLVPKEPIKEGALGFRVAIHNNVVVSGNFLSGANRSYIFQRPAGGWPATAELHSFTGTDTVERDAFGGAVALVGSELFVSAPGVDTNFNANVGAFYAYDLKPDADDDLVPDDQDQCPDAPDVDSDGDGVLDCKDNCPADVNADQADSDGDGTGDVCAVPAGDANGCCGGGVATATPLLMLLIPRGKRPRRSNA